MNKRLLSVLAFGIIVSGIASIILYRLIAAKMTAASSAPSRPVVVAVRPLPLGTLLKDSDVKIAAWTGTPPAGTASRPEDVIGRGVVAEILQDEPVVESRLAPRGAGAGLAAIIPPGMRAVAVAVNEVVGVAGFVVPGMHVDLLISGNPPGGNASAGTQTRTLLQNIEVLSAGQNIQKDAEGKPLPVQVVNVLVTPEQAEILSLATHETRIQMVLRNPVDKEIVKTPGTFVANLFGSNVVKPPASAVRQPGAARPAAAKPVAQVKPPEKPVIVPIIVEVITGSKKTESKFQPEAETKQ